MHSDSLNYTIVTGTGAPAWIELSLNGSLHLAADGPAYTPGGSNLFSFDVEVTDPEDATGTGRVTIEVVDRNFPPDATSPSVSVSESLEAGQVVLDGSAGSQQPLATDQDTGDTLTYAITRIVPGEGTPLFSMSQAGVLTLLPPGLDFESEPVHTVEYSVQDDGNGRLQSAGTITINVQNELEPPAVTGFDTN